VAKFFGELGFSTGTVETPANSGIYVDTIVERQYYGDVIRNSRRLESGPKVNFDLVVSNSISVVADAYANENFHAIRYIRWMGTLWIVTTVEVQRPRLLSELGGVYNGPTA
jgi:hypothetical protein